MIFLIISNEQSWYCDNVIRYYVPWHMLSKELSIILCRTARGILAWTNPPSPDTHGASLTVQGVLLGPLVPRYPLGITRDKMIPRGYRGTCRCVPTRAHSVFPFFFVLPFCLASPIDLHPFLFSFLHFYRLFYSLFPFLLTSLPLFCFFLSIFSSLFSHMFFSNFFF